MARKKREFVYLRDGDGYACSCGEILVDQKEFMRHCGKGNHKSVGKAVIATKEDANEFYYNRGFGPVKLSVLSGTYGMTKKKTTKKTPKKNIKKPVNKTTTTDQEIEDTTVLEDPQITDDEPNEDQVSEDTPAADPPEDKQTTKKGKKDSATRTTDYMPEATLLRLVPKVYQMTLTPTMQMTFHLARNVFPHIWPKDWSFERILDDMLSDYWEDRDVHILPCQLGPTAMEAINASNNGSHEEEEVPV